VKLRIKGEDEGLFEEMFGDIITMEEKINRAISICQKIENNEKKEFCLALMKDNSIECEKQPEIFKETCYLVFALRKDNVSLCEKTLDEESCLATVLKDYTKCETSKDKNACLSNIAELLKDSSICSQIEDSQFANNCFGSINQDVSFCKKIEGDLGDVCSIGVAVSKNDLSICNEMPSEKQNTCKAFVNKDKSNIDCTTTLIAPMYCLLLSVATDDESLCESLATTKEEDFYQQLFKTYKDTCYASVAIQILSTL
jgi:hypothetical protein